MPVRFPPILPSDLRLDDLDQVVGEDTPAYVALHPVRAVIRTAREPTMTPQDADPPFDLGPKPKASPKPLLPFVRAQLRRSFAIPREHNSLDFHLGGQALILGRGDPRSPATR